VPGSKPILIAAAVVAVACPASAFARAYNGPAGSGPNAGVEFGAHFHKGRPVRVFRFEYHNIPAQCQGSTPTATTGQLGMTLKVNARRKFGGRAMIDGGKVSVRVHGRFAKNYSKATGTLRVRGTVSGCLAADTGVVDWRAPALSG
jgi:hypothetical protein